MGLLVRRTWNVVVELAVQRDGFGCGWGKERRRRTCRGLRHMRGGEDMGRRLFPSLFCFCLYFDSLDGTDFGLQVTHKTRVKKKMMKGVVGAT